MSLLPKTNGIVQEVSKKESLKQRKRGRPRKKVKRNDDETVSSLKEVEKSASAGNDTNLKKSSSGGRGKPRTMPADDDLDRLDEIWDAFE